MMQQPRSSSLLTLGKPLMLFAAMLSACASESEGSPVPAAAQTQQMLRVDDSPEAVVMAEAQQHLADYLALIQDGQESDWGFQDRSEFVRAKLARPYEMLDLRDDGTTTPLNVWRVPVTVDGQARALLTVEKLEGVYKTTGFGATALAAELGKVEAKHSGSGQAIHGRSILRSFRRVADFVSYDSNARQLSTSGSGRARPLQSAKLAFSTKLDRMQRAHITANGIANVNDEAETLDGSSLKSLLAE